MPHCRDRRIRRRGLAAAAAAAVAVAAAAAILVLAGCTADRGPGPTAAPEVVVQVLDETGVPLPGATVAGDGTDRRSGTDGRVTLPVPHGATLAIVSAAGHLTEPVPIGATANAPGGPEITVRLLSDRGGKRIVMNSGGDVMFGRRYETGGAPGAPLVPPGEASIGAQDVVRHIAPAFRPADLRTVNLETVVSDEPATRAYPRKRYILNSAPETLAGLKSLGVDVPLLANNHTRDFRDAGLADTRTALTAAGFPVVGLTDKDGLSQPFHTAIRGTNVGVIAFTSIDGDSVNDSYPDVGPDRGHTGGDAWMYAGRAWGFPDAGVPARERTIGAAWRLYLRQEKGAQATPMWKSLAKVYPELQDWAGRRGHPGPAHWDDATSPAQIRALAKRNTLTVVQLHAGFQFQDESASATRRMARAAIDAGADIVVCHHPHVLQGMEFYKGRLIAYSLGNLVFDQDFLSTFSTAFLRTVWEGDRLVEARLVPVEIDGYRPKPDTGASARRTVLRAWENSLSDAQATHTDADGIIPLPLTRDADSEPAQFRLDHGTALITPAQPREQPLTVTVPAKQDAPIGFPGLIQQDRRGADGVLLGRDLFGWGHFDDDLADQADSGAVHWVTHPPDATLGRDPDGNRFLHLKGFSGDDSQARPIARIPLRRHRLYRMAGDGPEPADQDPTYTLHARVRLAKKSTPFLRLAVYRFDDANPTEDPNSVRLHDIMEPIAVPADGAWHDVSFSLTPARLAGNMVLIYAGISPGERPHADPDSADLDDVTFVEWRPAATTGWRPYDYVRNPTGAPVTVRLRGLPVV